MAVYSVHARGAAPLQIADAAFVREGFSLCAFLFGPAWLAWRRLWTALLAFIGLWFVLVAAAALNVWSVPAALAALFLLHLLLGLEANRLLEARLGNRGLHLVDVVAARALEEAQGIFFRRFTPEELDGAAGPRS